MKFAANNLAFNQRNFSIMSLTSIGRILDMLGPSFLDLLPKHIGQIVGISSSSALSLESFGLQVIFGEIGRVDWQSVHWTWPPVVSVAVGHI